MTVIITASGGLVLDLSTGVFEQGTGLCDVLVEVGRFRDTDPFQYLSVALRIIIWLMGVNLKSKIQSVENLKNIKNI